MQRRGRAKGANAAGKKRGRPRLSGSPIPDSKLAAAATDTDGDVGPGRIATKKRRKVQLGKKCLQKGDLAVAAGAAGPLKGKKRKRRPGVDVPADSNNTADAAAAAAAAAAAVVKKKPGRPRKHKPDADLALEGTAAHPNAEQPPAGNNSPAETSPRSDVADPSSSASKRAKQGTVTQQPAELAVSVDAPAPSGRSRGKKKAAAAEDSTGADAGVHTSKDWSAQGVATATKSACANKTGAPAPRKQKSAAGKKGSELHTGGSAAWLQVSRRLLAGKSAKTNTASAQERAVVEAQAASGPVSGGKARLEGSSRKVAASMSTKAEAQWAEKKRAAGKGNEASRAEAGGSGAGDLTRMFRKPESRSAKTNTASAPKGTAASASEAAGTQNGGRAAWLEVSRKMAASQSAKAQTPAAKQNTKGKAKEGAGPAHGGRAHWLDVSRKLVASQSGKASKGAAEKKKATNGKQGRGAAWLDVSRQLVAKAKKALRGSDSNGESIAVGAVPVTIQAEVSVNQDYRYAEDFHSVLYRTGEIAAAESHALVLSIFPLYEYGAGMWQLLKWSVCVLLMQAAQA